MGIADFFPSSKLCFECGSIKNDLELKDRIYKCECGYQEDRDINASKNIKREGINILKKQGINLLKNSTVVTDGKLRLSDMIQVTGSGGEATKSLASW